MQLDFGFPWTDPPSRAAAARAMSARGHRAEQLEFYGFDRLQQHTYFFALLADRPTAEAVDAVRRDLVAASGLPVRTADPSRLHISLLCLLKQSARPLSIDAEEAALEAVRLVRSDPFELTLDRATTFRRPAEDTAAKRPIVLTASRPTPLRGLFERLHGALERARIIGGKPQAFLPHMTLFYDSNAVDRDIAPITWTVRDFHFVHSLHGKSQYRTVGSFPLRA